MIGTGNEENNDVALAGEASTQCVHAKGGACNMKATPKDDCNWCKKDSLNSLKAMSTQSSVKDKRNKASTQDNDPHSILFTPNRNFAVKRVELLRIMIQSLRELGHNHVACMLEKESGNLEQDPRISCLEEHILGGNWGAASDVLTTLLRGTARRSCIGIGDSSVSDTLIRCKILISRESYLESMEDEDISKGLQCLNRLTSLQERLGKNFNELESLSSLLILPSHAHVMERLKNRSENRSTNRSALFDRLREILPQSLVLRPKRLLQLVDHAIMEQARHCTASGFSGGYQEDCQIMPLTTDLAVYGNSNRNIIPSRVVQVISDHHDGDVELWLCKFSNDGNLFASSAGSFLAVHRVVYSKCNVEKLEDKTLGTSLDHGSTQPLTLVARLVNSNSKSTIFCFGWSPDDHWVACGDASGNICLWDMDMHFKKGNNDVISSPAETKQLEIEGMAVPLPHSDRVTAVTWMDPEHFVTGSFDCSIRLYDTRLHLVAYWASSPIYDLFFSSKIGSLVAACNIPRYLRLFSLFTVLKGKRTRKNGKSRFNSRSSVNGTSVLSTENGNNGVSAQRYSGGTGRVHELTLPTNVFKTERVVSSLTSDRQGCTFVTQHAGSNCLIEWDALSGNPNAFFGGVHLEKGVMRASVGGLGDTLLACGTVDAQIAIWDRSPLAVDSILSNPRQPISLLSGHTQPVNAVAWSPVESSFLVSASDDGTLRVWN